MPEPIVIPAEAIEALRRGSKIEAIKLVRDNTGIGLREAKDAVDEFEKHNPVAADGIGTGEAEKSGRGLWILLLVVGAAVGYYFMSR